MSWSYCPGCGQSMPPSMDVCPECDSSEQASESSGAVEQTAPDAWTARQVALYGSATCLCGSGLSPEECCG